MRLLAELSISTMEGSLVLFTGIGFDIQTDQQLREYPVSGHAFAEDLDHVHVLLRS